MNNNRGSTTTNNGSLLPKLYKQKCRVCGDHNMLCNESKLKNIIIVRMQLYRASFKSVPLGWMVPLLENWWRFTTRMQIYGKRENWLITTYRKTRKMYNLLSFNRTQWWLYIWNNHTRWIHVNCNSKFMESSSKVIPNIDSLLCSIKMDKIVHLSRLSITCN